MNKPELLSPAGNLENLKVAVIYGADAVYISGKKYGLRAKADNATLDEIKEGVIFAHKKKKKIYVTLNIVPHNDDLEGLDRYVKELAQTAIDGVIVSDPGIISIVKETAPGLPIHLSTQANNTNYKSAQFWHGQGIKRITLARELSLKEIESIRSKTPHSLELEAFVHGAVCISYSGRCMLSSYMIGRDANKGDCAHSCRWHYTLIEEKRPGEYLQVYEDDRGTYIFNSKDLCLIEHIPDLIKAGVTSFKIEGRMKSSYYVAVVTSIYRRAIDEYMKNPHTYTFNSVLLEELKKVNHRQYSKGFFMSKPGSGEYIYDSSGYTYSYIYCGLIISYNETTKTAAVRVQNKIIKGDTVEIIGPYRGYFEQRIDEIRDEENNYIDSAPHPQQIVTIPMSQPVASFDMIRKQTCCMEGRE